MQTNIGKEVASYFFQKKKPSKRKVARLRNLARKEARLEGAQIPNFF